MLCEDLKHTKASDLKALIATEFQQDLWDYTRVIKLCHASFLENKVNSSSS